MTTYGNRYEHDPFADYRCQQHLAVVDLDGCWMCPDCRKSSVVVDYTTGDYICSVRMSATCMELIVIVWIILTLYLSIYNIIQW